jgi:hypothetical protein
MKAIYFFSAALLLFGCETPKEQEPNLDEMVLSEDEEILEGTLSGELAETPQERPLIEPLEPEFKVE